MDLTLDLTLDLALHFGMQEKASTRLDNVWTTTWLLLILLLLMEKPIQLINKFFDGT